MSRKRNHLDSGSQDSNKRQAVFDIQTMLVPEETFQQQILEHARRQQTNRLFAHSINSVTKAWLESLLENLKNNQEKLVLPKPQPGFDFELAHICLSDAKYYSDKIVIYNNAIRSDLIPANYWGISTDARKKIDAKIAEKIVRINKSREEKRLIWARLYANFLKYHSEPESDVIIPCDLPDTQNTLLLKELQKLPATITCLSIGRVWITMVSDLRQVFIENPGLKKLIITEPVTESDVGELLEILSVETLKEIELTLKQETNEQSSTSSSSFEYSSCRSSSAVSTLHKLVQVRHKIADIRLQFRLTPDDEKAEFIRKHAANSAMQDSNPKRPADQDRQIEWAYLHCNSHYLRRVKFYALNTGKQVDDILLDGLLATATELRVLMLNINSYETVCLSQWFAKLGQLIKSNPKLTSVAVSGDLRKINVRALNDALMQSQYGIVQLDLSKTTIEDVHLERLSVVMKSKYFIGLRVNSTLLTATSLTTLKNILDENKRFSYLHLVPNIKSVEAGDKYIPGYKTIVGGYEPGYREKTYKNKDDTQLTRSQIKDFCNELKNHVSLLDVSFGKDVDCYNGNPVNYVHNVVKKKVNAQAELEAELIKADPDASKVTNLLKNACVSCFCFNPQTGKFLFHRALNNLDIVAIFLQQGAHPYLPARVFSKDVNLNTPSILDVLTCDAQSVAEGHGISKADYFELMSPQPRQQSVLSEPAEQKSKTSKQDIRNFFASSSQAASNQTILSNSDLNSSVLLHLSQIRGLTDQQQQQLNQAVGLLLTSGAQAISSSADMSPQSTALHHAICSRNYQLVKVLMQSEAFATQLTEADGEGNTPLHLAVMTGQPEFVRLLLRNRCITSLTAGRANHAGQTPVMIARDEYNKVQYSFSIEKDNWQQILNLCEALKNKQLPAKNIAAYWVKDLTIFCGTRTQRLAISLTDLHGRLKTEVSADGANHVHAAITVIIRKSNGQLTYQTIDIDDSQFSEVIGQESTNRNLRQNLIAERLQALPEGYPFATDLRQPDKALSVSAIEQLNDREGITFAQRFHHSEQTLLECIANRVVISYLVDQLRGKGLSADDKVMGVVLSMYSDKYVCTNCEASILGEQRLKQANNHFLGAFSARLNTFNITTPKAGIRMITTVTASGPCAGRSYQSPEDQQTLIVDLKRDDGIIMQQVANSARPTGFSSRSNH